MTTARCWKAKRRAISASQEPWPGHDAHGLWRPSPVSSRPISRTYPGKYFTGDGAGAMRTATTGSSAASMTSSTSPATASAPPKSKARWSHMPRSAEAAVVGYPHEIKGQGIYAYVTLKTGTEPSRSCARNCRMGAQGNRPDRHSRQDPVRARLAQDPLRQDHAPHPAQDRRERAGSLGDTSTLADPAVVDDLVKHRQNKKDASPRAADSVPRMLRSAPRLRRGALLIGVQTANVVILAFVGPALRSSAERRCTASVAGNHCFWPSRNRQRGQPGVRVFGRVLFSGHLLCFEHFHSVATVETSLPAGVETSRLSARG